MWNELLSEFIKNKRSYSFYCSLIIPILFLIYALFSKLSTQNPTGLISHTPIILITIYNIYTLIFIPLMTSLIIYLDYKKEKENNSSSLMISNNWNIKKIVMSKFLNYIFLSLISYLILSIIILISNLITTGLTFNISKIIIANLLLWLLSISLIAINMLVLSYLNFLPTYIINIVITLFFGLKPFFDQKISLFVPWVYGLKVERLVFNIEPSGLLGTNIHSSSQVQQLEIMIMVNILIVILFIYIIHRGFKFYARRVEK